MMKHKYKPYIRNQHPEDTAPDMRTAMRLAYYEMVKDGGYVCVQRGFPNRVIAVGNSKKHVRRIFGAYSSREWKQKQRRIKSFGQLRP